MASKWASTWQGRIHSNYLLVPSRPQARNGGGVDGDTTRRHVINAALPPGRSLHRLLRFDGGLRDEVLRRFLPPDLAMRRLRRMEEAGVDACRDDVDGVRGEGAGSAWAHPEVESGGGR